MTPLLIALLIWILLGGSVYLFCINSMEEGYRVCKEPCTKDLFYKSFTSRRLLIVCLIIGPVLVALVPVLYLIDFLFGDIDDDF